MNHSSQARTKLSASIVTYNSIHQIETVLNCLLQIPYLEPRHIHVIDNASSDGTLTLIRQKFPQVSLLPLEQNLGFGHGHNQVLPLLNSDYHMVVNPDIECTAHEIEKMAQYMQGHPKTVLLSPKVLFPTGQEQFLPKELPSIRFLAGGFFEGLGGVFPRWREEYTWQNKKINKPVPTFFATGCFMFVSTKAYQEVGGFDLRYFLYMEDIDLTRKLAQVGDIIYHPHITVTHHWARESARKVKSIKLHLQSVWKYFNKWGWRF